MKLNGYPKTHYEYITKLHSYHEFPRDNFRDISFTEFLQQFDDPTDKATLTGIHFQFHLMQMVVHREKIFYIPDSLSEMLKTADVNVSSKFVQSPYKEMYISVKHDDIYITDGEDITEIAGYYINFRQHGNFKTIIAIANSDVSLIEEERDVLQFFSFCIYDHETVNEALSRSQTDLREREVSEESMEAFLEVIRRIIGILLYITSAGARFEDVRPKSFIEAAGKLSNPKKIRRAVKAAASYAQQPFILVLPPTPRDPVAMSAVTGEEDTEKSRKIMKQFTVRGHFRQQWVGSENDGTRRQKLIFIQPFTKGPDFAEAINKKYILKM